MAEPRKKRPFLTREERRKIRFLRTGEWLKTYKDFADELADILELPKETFRASKEATRIVHAVFEAITAAMHREERVYVAGFGEFKVRRGKPRPFYARYFYGQKRNVPAELTIITPRPTVVFYPCDSLIRTVNAGAEEV